MVVTPTSQAVASSAYLYDNAGRLTSLQHTGMENGATASNPLAGYAFTWDSADRLTSVNSVKDGLVNYSYDSTGQVTGADFTGQTDESFTYDSNGNRTSVLPGSPNPAVTIRLHNRILNNGEFTYTYDAEGNRTSKTDNVSGSKVEYAWNHANLLTAVVYKTSNNVVTKSVAYQYDALGRRIGKSVDDNGNGTVVRRESYIYDGAGLLSSFSTGIGGEGARRADDGAAIHISGPNGVMGQHGWVDQMVLSFVDPDGDSSSPSQLASRNLYGDAVDQIFATESGSGDVFWALTDHQGTPRDWATRSASGTTTIAQHTRYTAFGAIASVVDGSGASLATSPSLLASFTGQLHDPDVDLLYYRARWYDPQLGKFLSDDPMGFAAGDANVSRYVGNSTSSTTDATGLWPPVYPPQGLHLPVLPVFLLDPGPDPLQKLKDPIKNGTWAGPNNLRPTLQTQYGKPPIKVLPKFPLAYYTGGQNGSLFWNIPDNRLVGVGGAEPCILVLVVSPQCDSCDGPHVLAYHFNTSHDPDATLLRDGMHIPDGSHILIGAGDNSNESNGTLNSVNRYLQRRGNEVFVDGIVDTCQIMVDNNGTYYTNQTAVNLWNN